MWKFAAVIAAVIMGVMLFRNSKLPAEQLPVYTQGAQDGRAQVGGRCPQPRCVTVYLAPWCPYCRTMQGTIADLRRQLDSEGVGVHVVLGMDKLPSLTRYADSFHHAVLLDEQGAFQRGAGVKRVPHFIVSNRQGEVVREFSGSSSDVGAVRQRLGL